MSTRLENWRRVIGHWSQKFMRSLLASRRHKLSAKVEGSFGGSESSPAAGPLEGPAQGALMTYCGGKAALTLPNIAKDQPVAKSTKDICLIGFRRSPEAAKAIAIDVEQSQSQQKA
jgi:hypothetical protein